MRKSLTPLTGVLFVVLVIVSFVIGGEPPDAQEGRQAIVDHYVENKSTVIVGAVLGGFAVVALLFFFNHLRSVFRRAEPAGAELSTMVLAGAILMGAGFAFDGTLMFAMAEAADDIDPVALQGLQALWDRDFIPMAAGMLTVLLASGLSIVRYRAMPVWLGWVAIVLGVGALTPVGFFAFIGAALWILIVAALLFTRGDRKAPAPTI